MSAPSASKRRQRYDALGATYGDVEDQELSADDQIEKNKQLLMQQVVDLETRVAELVTEVETKTSEKNTADAQLQALRAQIDEATSRDTEVQAALQASQQSLTAVQAESVATKASLTDATARLEQSQTALQASEGSLQALQSENAAVQQSLAAANAQKADVDTDLQRVQSELVAKTAESRTCTQALEASQQTLSDLQARNDVLTGQVSNTSSQLETLSAEKARTNASLAEAQQQLATVFAELDQLRATAGKQTSDNSELQRVQEALMAQITATVELLTEWPTTDPWKTAPLIDKLMLYAPTSLWNNDLSETSLKMLPPINGILASIATELEVVEALKALGSAPTATAGGAGAASAQTAVQSAMLAALNGYEARLVGFKRIVRRQARKLTEKLLNPYTGGPNPQSRVDAVHLYYQMKQGTAVPPGSEVFLREKHDMPEAKENDDAKRARGGAVSSGRNDDYKKHTSDSESGDDAGGGGSGSSNAGGGSSKKARTVSEKASTPQPNAASGTVGTSKAARKPSAPSPSPSPSPVMVSLLGLTAPSSSVAETSVQALKRRATTNVEDASAPTSRAEEEFSENPLLRSVDIKEADDELRKLRNSLISAVKKEDPTFKFSKSKKDNEKGEDIRTDIVKLQEKLRLQRAGRT